MLCYSSCACCTESGRCAKSSAELMFWRRLNGFYSVVQMHRSHPLLLVILMGILFISGCCKSIRSFSHVVLTLRLS